MTDLLEEVGRQLTAQHLPFTEPDSRLLVLPTKAGVAVHTAEYERSPDRCRVLPELSISRPGREPVPVSSVRPDHIRYADGLSTLAFVDRDHLTLRLSAGEWVVRLRTDTPVLTSQGGSSPVGLPSAGHLAWQVRADRHAQRVVTAEGTAMVEIDTADAAGSGLVLGVGPTAGPPLAVPPSQDPVAESQARWEGWFDLLPAVPPHLRSTAWLAWWVLAANTLRLQSEPDTPVVVPSKLGYVAHWHWDACFIAMGLRHGAADLARAQLELALKHQQPDGMFVDVIHDFGTLAATGDLPTTDLERLAGHFGIAPGATHPTGAAVPVTKPPVLAYATNRVLQSQPDEDLRGRVREAALRNQRWWLTSSDTDGDGLAEYLHPYSSGLDDNPVFDLGAPTATPDLNSYLALQYDELAAMSEAAGRPADARRLRDEAQRHTDRLIERQWSTTARRFVPLVRGSAGGPHTVTDLLPLVTGRLPPEIGEAVCLDLTDPATFGRYPTAPTVSRADPAFRADRMWRGPVWLNTNYLLIDGLCRQGRDRLADELTRQTLQLVCESGELAEYWDAGSATRAPSAVPMFSWSAALFVDLAVRWGERS